MSCCISFVYTYIFTLNAPPFTILASSPVQIAVVLPFSPAVSCARWNHRTRQLRLYTKTSYLRIGEFPLFSSPPHLKSYTGKPKNILHLIFVKKYFGFFCQYYVELFWNLRSWILVFYQVSCLPWQYSPIWCATLSYPDLLHRCLLHR